MQKKVPLGTVVGALAFGIAFYFAEGAFRTTGHKGDDAFRKALSATMQANADKMNAQCPIVIDEHERTDRVSFTMGGTGKNMKPKYVYYRTVTDVITADLTKEDFLSTVRGLLVKKFCAAPELEQIFKGGGGYAFIYSTPDGVEIGRVDMDGSDCELLKATPSPG